MEDELKDLKEAIIYTVNTSKETNAVDLFAELLDLLYTKGFSDGQDYLLNREP